MTWICIWLSSQHWRSKVKR